MAIEIGEKKIIIFYRVLNYIIYIFCHLIVILLSLLLLNNETSWTELKQKSSDLK